MQNRTCEDLIRAAMEHDCAAFVALLGSGIDVNSRGEKGRTALHNLFANRDLCYGVSPSSDFIAVHSEKILFRFIDLLIQHGAKPVKDEALRTPLMCISYNKTFLLFPPTGSGNNHHVIDKYSDWEADTLGLNRSEYRTKLIEFLEHRFSLNEAIAKSQANDFWESFSFPYIEKNSINFFTRYSPVVRLNTREESKRS